MEETSGVLRKGVVTLPNGQWGAQIYANNQRIWLGTFISEEDAAMAYDSAAMKLRNGFQDRQGIHEMSKLFEKELTPSDVSKLNRLVIPNKFAVKYFPRISGVGDIELLFFDRSMRSWNFRYCYWKSSQSFVFTRGWSRFAKEKGLRSRDRVIFSSYEASGHKICILDVAYHDGPGARGRPAINEGDEALDLKMERLRFD